MPITGEVGIGVMGVMGQNADQAGRYNGLNTTGVDAIGNSTFAAAPLELRRNPVISTSTATIWSSRLAATALGSGIACGNSYWSSTSPTTDWRTTVGGFQASASRAPGGRGLL
jgi:hypothetical protein